MLADNWHKASIQKTKYQKMSYCACVNLLSQQKRKYSWQQKIPLCSKQNTDWHIQATFSTMTLFFNSRAQPHFPSWQFIKNLHLDFFKWCQFTTEHLRALCKRKQVQILNPNHSKTDPVSNLLAVQSEVPVSKSYLRKAAGCVESSAKLSCWTACWRQWKGTVKMELLTKNKISIPKPICEYLKAHKFRTKAEKRLICLKCFK